MKLLAPQTLFKLTHPNAKLPTLAHGDDAGYDLYSIDDITINPMQRVIVRTGLTMALPKMQYMVLGELKDSTHGIVDPGKQFVQTTLVEVAFEAQVRPRSGNAFAYGLAVLNSPGTIDAGYRKEVGVILINMSDTPHHIKVGDRIAQMIFSLAMHPELLLVDVLPDSERKDGFGHTGD